MNRALLLLIGLSCAWGCGDDTTPPDSGGIRTDAGSADVSVRRDAGSPDVVVVRTDAGPQTECESAADCAAGLVCAGNICQEREVGDCAIADCRMGAALSCDGTLSLDCNQFGGSCQAFSDGTDDFSWCGCGDLAEGEGGCTGSRAGYACQEGITQLLECPAGSTCDSSGGSVGCVCDNLDDGICPGTECIEDPDCGACTPSCGSNECGDNGCGGSCGSCGLGTTCEGGSCEDSCTPSCDGRACGTDGCGGTCGSCTAPDSCNASSGLCESECVPSCDDGQVCGPDGCGGTCGSMCAADRECRRCPSGATCAVESYDCRCPLFGGFLAYEFDATGIDWSEINFIAMNVNHFTLDGSRGPTRGVLLDDDETSETYRVNGCEADIEIRRSYSMAGGVTCEFTDRVSRTDIVIPQPTLSGGSCTAPAL